MGELTPEYCRSWALAAGFPPDKERVYPQHARVQEFDDHVSVKVLEYGCGGGSDAMSYMRRGCEVWYADIVESNVSAATERMRTRGLSGHSVVLSASSPLPFESESFDVVNAHGVLHHVEEPAPVVSEFFRVLRSRGLLYVMLYTEYLWARCQGAMADRLVRRLARTSFEAFCQMTDYGAPYARAYTEGEGARLLQDAGLVVERSSVWNGGDFRTFRARRPC